MRSCIFIDESYRVSCFNSNAAWRKSRRGNFYSFRRGLKCGGGSWSRRRSWLRRSGWLSRSWSRCCSGATSDTNLTLIFTWWCCSLDKEKTSDQCYYNQSNDDCNHWCYALFLWKFIHGFERKQGFINVFYFFSERKNYKDTFPTLAMNLRSMLIVELAKEDVPSSLQERYHDGCPLFARIESPLVYEQYEALVLDFLRHSCAYALHVRKNCWWERFLKHEAQDQIDSLMVLAESDTRKRDHLSLEFRKGKFSEPARVHFGEESGRIQVVKAFIPTNLEHLFRVERDMYFYSEIKAFALHDRRRAFGVEKFALALKGEGF